MQVLYLKSETTGWQVLGYLGNPVVGAEFEITI